MQNEILIDFEPDLTQLVLQRSSEIFQEDI